MADRKCKFKGDCEPSPECKDCENNKPRTLTECLQEEIDTKMKNGDISHTFACKMNDGIYIRNYDYNKIQNYIEAIRLIAEKVGTVESDCIEQLARDVGNYLYDLVKGDKND